MTKKIMFFTMAFLMLAGLALAQDAEPIEINTAMVEAILAFSIGGVGAAQLTEILKRLLSKLIPQAGNILGIASALIVAVALTATYLVSTGGFTIPLFIGYSILVFGGATGLFKMVHKPS